MGLALLLSATRNASPIVLEDEAGGSFNALRPKTPGKPVPDGATT